MKKYLYSLKDRKNRVSNVLFQVMNAFFCMFSYGAYPLTKQLITFITITTEEIRDTVQLRTSA